MKLLHRGLTIELPDDDPRIPIMEALLFGRSLPPPLPAPAIPTPTPAAPPAPPVPQAMREFWSALTPVERKELTLLATRAYRPQEMESALGISQRKLMGRHSRLARLAKRFKVPARVRVRGRGRKGRSYWIDQASAVLVRVLAAETVEPATTKEARSDAPPAGT
ncbi:MAG: hypothetical protein AB2A00_41085 [Myxococcota bacterium]